MMDARFSQNMSFVSGVADSVGAYMLIRVNGGIKAESQKALGAATAWLSHSQQAVLHCRSYSVLPGLAGALPLPEECVVLLLQGTRVCKSCFLESSNVHVQSSQLIVNDSCLSGVLDFLQTCGEAGHHCPDIPTPQF